MGLFLLFFILGALIGLFRYIQFYEVAGEGMAPALTEGKTYLILKGKSKPKRGQVVVFLYEGENGALLQEWYGPDYDRHQKLDGCVFIKRVIGIGGDTVEIRDGKVQLNGRPLAEPYATLGEDEEVQDLAPFRIPEGSMFVMGDNRDWTWDSRHFGPVRYEKIQGRLLFV